MYYKSPKTEASAERDTKPPPSSSTMILDKHGDLTLEVGPGLTSFKVSSAALRRASPVFGAMLFGPWSESKPSNGSTSGDNVQWTVRLPDDEPAAMLVVLAIAHAVFRLVPDRLSGNEIFDILVVAHKYDMVELIRPWAKDFSFVLRKDTDDRLSRAEDYLPGLLQDMSCAWVMGEEKIFVERVWALIRHLNRDAELSVDHGDNEPQNPADVLRLDEMDYMGPVDLLGTYLNCFFDIFWVTNDRFIITFSFVIDTMLNIREATIQIILDVLYAEVDYRLNLTAVRFCKCTFKASAAECVSCDQVMLSLLCGLVVPNKDGSSLPRRAEDMTGTIETCYKSLLGRLWRHRDITGSEHKGCSHFTTNQVNMCEHAGRWLEKMTNELVRKEGTLFPTQAHKDYMARQREKLGL